MPAARTRPAAAAYEKLLARARTANRFPTAPPSWWVEMVEFESEAYASSCAATLLSLAASLPALHEARGPQAWPWLLAGSAKLAEVVRDALSLFGFEDAAEELPTWAESQGLTAAGPVEADPWQAYELLLAACNPRERRGRGVYFTPQLIARALAEAVDSSVREEFGYSRGLAADDPFVQVLDPAAGAGSLLAAAIEQARESFLAGDESRANVARWARFAVESLVPRIAGLEISPAAWAVAHVQLAVTLARGGCRPREPLRFRLYLSDTLDPADSSKEARKLKCEPGPTVLLANPPYRSLTAHAQPFLDRLLRGEPPGDGTPGRSYYEAEGKPLGRRKLWLHDDYVKFIRWCQWRIDQAGAGIVGLIANRGYLENPTFRGMRQQLLETFGRMAFLDLRGDVRGGEPARGDEGIFANGQGIAVSLWRRVPDDAARSITHGSIRGSRAEKLATMATTPLLELACEPLEPRSPEFLFAPSAAVPPEYAAFHALDEIFPVNGSAAVTARDGLVIAFTEEELLARIERLRDPAIDDETLRRELFPKPRTERYPRGDTRSWRLSEVRARLRAEPNWRACVRRCWYRPWDSRFVYWSPLLIDWPRTETMRHLLEGSNLALVARRQSPAEAPADFFWVSDTPVIDGLLRSDNRGNETFFPLRLSGGGVNLGEAFASELERTIGRETPPAAEEAFACLYALCHSLGYQRRYAAALRQALPRLPVPRTAELLEELATLGGELIDLHLLRNITAVSIEMEGGPEVAGGRFPCFENGRVQVSAEGFLHPVSETAWEFRVGSHQPARKWLRERRGRRLTAEEVRCYGRLLAAADGTIALRKRIEAALEARGGWPAALGME